MPLRLGNNIGGGFLFTPDLRPVKKTTSNALMMAILREWVSGSPIWRSSFLTVGSLERDRPTASEKSKL